MDSVSVGRDVWGGVLPVSRCAQIWLFPNTTYLQHCQEVSTNAGSCAHSPKILVPRDGVGLRGRTFKTSPVILRISHVLSSQVQNPLTCLLPHWFPILSHRRAGLRADGRLVERLQGPQTRGRGGRRGRGCWRGRGRCGFPGGDRRRPHMGESPLTTGSETEVVPNSEMLRPRGSDPRG